MKKYVFLLISMLLIASSVWAAEPADTARFDNERTVLIVSTTQEGYPVRYMMRKLREPFRLPYWDRLEATEIISPQDITEDTMKTLAETYKADLVVVPVVRTWVWQQRHIWLGWYDDSEIITECWYNLAIYVWNSKDQTLKSYSSRGSRRDEASILNNPDDVLFNAMGQIMEKLPYKRIPTDIDRNELNE